MKKRAKAVSEMDLYPKTVRIIEVKGPYSVGRDGQSAWCYHQAGKPTDVHAQIIIRGELYHVVLSVPLRASRKGRRGSRP